MRIRVALTVAIVLATTASAGGESCRQGSPEIITPPTVSVHGGSGVYYIDNEPCDPGCLRSVSIYEETNEIDGLQLQDMFGQCPYPDTQLL